VTASARLAAAWIALALAQHRANIETCIYTRHGVGDRDRVWTHVFYLPR
jgi:hypothetical protein